jgi:hypothetical protein
MQENRKKNLASEVEMKIAIYKSILKNGKYRTLLIENNGKGIKVQILCT